LLCGTESSAGRGAGLVRWKSLVKLGYDFISL
jgi:hypothetical protein